MTIKRVIKQEVENGSPIYGVIMTQTELDLVSALLGEVDGSLIMQGNLWDHMDSHTQESWVLNNDKPIGLYENAKFDHQDRLFKEQFAKELAELEGTEVFPAPSPPPAPPPVAFVPPSPSTMKIIKGILAPKKKATRKKVGTFAPKKKPARSKPKRAKVKKVS